MGGTKEYFDLILIKDIDPWPTESQRTRLPPPPTTPPASTTTGNVYYAVPRPPLATLNTAPTFLSAVATTGNETTAVPVLSATISIISPIALPPLVAAQNATNANSLISLSMPQRPPPLISSPHASFDILPRQAPRLAHTSPNSSDASGSVVPTSSNSSESTGLSKKTTYEKNRGQQLRDKKIGGRAIFPCNHCVNKPHRCCVAIDPQSFDSFKCAYCISNKVSCSFNFENPGLEYPPEMMNQIQEKEQMKKAGRAKAKETNDKKKGKAKATQWTTVNDQRH
ncbi:hypothetical protein K449DRAFT_397256 [Hypoxylon sp. EC38]|nr:hypothetical protein K449DRAFT_397256 [Hypoxylon sp. EC38]